MAADLPPMDTSALPPMDVAGRVGRLRARFEELGCEAVVVTNLVNVRYLTGFSGSAAVLLVRADDLVLVTDGRYRSQAAEELAAAGVEAAIEIGAPARQQEVLTAAVTGLGRLGLEAGHVSWARKRAMAGWFSDVELAPTEGAVESLRMTKDVGEVARVAAAAAIADRALEAVSPLLVGGATEQEVALALDSEMRRLGASGSSFETIVAAGPNGAKPHARPSARRIEPGELVVIDFGAVVDGYCSDMTRTRCVGEPRNEELRRMAAVVERAQRLGAQAATAARPCAEVDGVCRDAIEEEGFGEAFVHSTGHGVGLDIHEAPWVSATSTDTLAAGHVVTVEPGIYIPDLGGVRIEDTVVVTEEGPRPLTCAPKELVLS